MKRKHLESILSQISQIDFINPNIQLEQYPTQPSLVCDIILIALLQYNDLGPNKSVIDLGCGTGILGIACCIVNTDTVYCIDCDINALQTCQSNSIDMNVQQQINFIHAQVQLQHYHPIYQNNDTTDTTDTTCSKEAAMTVDGCSTLQASLAELALQHNSTTGSTGFDQQTKTTQNSHSSNQTRDSDNSIQPGQDEITIQNDYDNDDERIKIIETNDDDVIHIENDNDKYDNDDDDNTDYNTDVNTDEIHQKRQQIRMSNDNEMNFLRSKKGKKGSRNNNHSYRTSGGRGGGQRNDPKIGKHRSHKQQQQQQVQGSRVNQPMHNNSTRVPGCIPPSLNNNSNDNHMYYYNDGIPLQDQCVDTVITNPPFGTKNNEGIDVSFVYCAIRLAKYTVYSFHKTSTRDYLLKTFSSKSIRRVKSIAVIAEMKFILPKSYKFHTHQSKDINVDLLRIELTE